MNHKPRTLDIEKLSHDGRGIARFDGKTQFVAGALPGEQVLAQPLALRKRFDELNTLEILKSSPDRQAPPCPQFDVCGGCQLQHLSHPAQVSSKQQALEEQLERIGHCQPAQLAPALQSPAQAYRTRARLACWYHPRNKQYLIGFRESGSKTITALDQCLILHPALDKLLPLLPELCKQCGFEKQLGHIDMQLHENSSDQVTPALCFRLLSPLSDKAQQALEAFAREHSCIIATQQQEKTAENLTGPTLLQYHLPAQNLALQFDWPDFTQANRMLNRAMVEQAIGYLELTAEDKVLDAFCGLGNFSLAIAQKANTVLGLEGSSAMVKRASDNAEANELENVRFDSCNLMEGDSLKRQLKKFKYNKVLIDPPRDGAAALCEYLSKNKAERLVYVSCNPSSLARDSKILTESAYTLETAGVVDMFPHSQHSESICVFVKNSKKKS